MRDGELFSQRAGRLTRPATLPNLHWAPYQEFGIPDPANETTEPPSGPIRVMSHGYRGNDIIVYWERA
jgi:hypothetical protein